MKRTREAQVMADAKLVDNMVGDPIGTCYIRCNRRPTSRNRSQRSLKICVLQGFRPGL